MDTTAILVTCIGSLLVAVAAFVAHRRLAGSAGRPGCLSMMAYVVGLLAVITALLTGLFLIAGRPAR